MERRWNSSVSIRPVRIYGKGWQVCWRLYSARLAKDCRNCAHQRCTQMLKTMVVFAKARGKQNQVDQTRRRNHGQSGQTIRPTRLVSHSQQTFPSHLRIHSKPPSARASSVQLCSEKWKAMPGTMVDSSRPIHQQKTVDRPRRYLIFAKVAPARKQMERDCFTHWGTHWVSS